MCGRRAGKGLRDRNVIFNHAFRKRLLIPTVTVLGLAIGSALLGAVLTETIFAWPGIGRYAYGAALALDFPAIIGVSLLTGVIFVAANLVVDLSYIVLDPGFTASISAHCTHHLRRELLAESDIRPVTSIAVKNCAAAPCRWAVSARVIFRCAATARCVSGKFTTNRIISAASPIRFLPFGQRRARPDEIEVHPPMTINARAAKQRVV